jgi:protein-histidine pros-kinase
MSLKINLLLGACFILITVLLVVQTMTNIRRTAYTDTLYRAELICDMAANSRSYNASHENHPKAMETIDLSGDVSGNAGEEAVGKNLRCEFLKSPEMAKIFSVKNGYRFKYVSLAPLNTHNSADDFEAGIIKDFSNTQNNIANKGVIKIKNKETGYFAKPVLYENSCLPCHMPQEKSFDTKNRGDDNKGHYYMKLGMPAGAVISYVPLENKSGEIKSEITQSLIRIMIPVIFVFGTLKLLVFIYIEKPLLRLTKLADEISKGKKLNVRIIKNGNDEIGELFLSLNRMRRCVNKLMKMAKMQKFKD